MPLKLLFNHRPCCPRPADFLRSVRQQLVKKQQGAVRVIAYGMTGIAHAMQLCAKVRKGAKGRGCRGG